MARWYKLEKIAPLKTKHGCIDKVLHVWPHRPPPDDVFARELGKQLIFLFKEDLLGLMAARSREKNALDATSELKVPRARKRRGKRVSDI